jgi:hypothetical protein
MEIGLAPNIMKGNSIFPLSIVGFILFFKLTSKLDVQCIRCVVGLKVRCVLIL